MRVVTTFVIAAIAMSARGPDPGNCGNWVPQTNGTKWRICTDQNNERYCELKSGRSITRIDCP